MAQVLTVGVAYFSDPACWQIHVWLVHGYSGLSLVLPIWSASASYSHRVRSLCASLPVLLGLQFGTIHLHTPLHLEELHPLIGFTLFSVSATIVHRLSRELFDKSTAASAS